MLDIPSEYHFLESFGSFRYLPYLVILLHPAFLLFGWYFLDGQPFPFLDLPSELQCHIFRKLSVAKLHKLKQVSKEVREMIARNWRHNFYREVVFQTIVYRLKLSLLTTGRGIQIFSRHRCSLPTFLLYFLYCWGEFKFSIFAHWSFDMMYIDGVCEFPGEYNVAFLRPAAESPKEKDFHQFHSEYHATMSHGFISRLRGEGHLLFVFS
uniref:F-box domain-containing protein n=1 Tax=Heterorhabditis bacteriophora TaxID=37862 RepID=A0A1I7WBQ8_HETBA